MSENSEFAIIFASNIDLLFETFNKRVLIYNYFIPTGICTGLTGVWMLRLKDAA